MKAFFVGLILLVLALNSSAQTNNVLFLKYQYDWGDMPSTQFQQTGFLFVNKTTKPVAILTVKAVYEVRISYAHTFVAPGDTGILYVSYESNQLGPFQQDIFVTLNVTDEPIKLTIKGNILSVNNCYPDVHNMNKREVRVVDSLTKQPVPNVACSFFCYTNGKQIDFVCGKDGKKVAELPIGMYDIQLSAPGYRTVVFSKQIPKTAPILFFEIPKLKKNLPPAKQISDESKPQALPINQPIITQNKENNQNTTEELPKNLYQPNNIVFLLDISKSMQQNQRFDRLKKCMSVLVNALRDNDMVSVVLYNTQSQVLFESIPGNAHQQIIVAIDTIHPTGFTDGVKGLGTAYAIAQKHFKANANNIVILATDGEFNGINQSPEQIASLIASKATEGTILSIVGFAEVKTVITMLKDMAKQGLGSYLQINEIPDERILINEIKIRSAINKQE